MVDPFPQLALGTAQWGMNYGFTNRDGKPDSKRVRAMLEIAKSANVTALDTARSYGDSERVIGENMDCSASWKILTKLEARSEFSQKQAKELARLSLAESRVALRREVLDAVLLHRPEQYDSGWWELLLEERLNLRIDSIGYSALNDQQAWKAIERPDVEIVQVPGGYLNQRLLREGWFQAAKDAGKSIVLRSIFLQGLALCDVNSIPDFAHPIASALRALDRWCEENGIERLTGLFTAARFFPVDLVLIGCEHPRQLRANIQAWNNSARLVSKATGLLEEVPDLPHAVTNPSMWPVTQ